MAVEPPGPAGNAQTGGDDDPPDTEEARERPTVPFPECGPPTVAGDLPRDIGFPDHEGCKKRRERDREQE